MIQQLQLEKLLIAVTEKSESYFRIGDHEAEKSIPFAGTYAEMLHKAKEEWRAAEHAYHSFLKAHNIKPVSAYCF